MYAHLDRMASKKRLTHTSSLSTDKFLWVDASTSSVHDVTHYVPNTSDHFLTIVFIIQVVKKLYIKKELIRMPQHSIITYMYYTVHTNEKVSKGALCAYHCVEHC